MSARRRDNKTTVAAVNQAAAAAAAAAQAGSNHTHEPTAAAAPPATALATAEPTALDTSEDASIAPSATTAASTTAMEDEPAASAPPAPAAAAAAALDSSGPHTHADDPSAADAPAAALAVSLPASADPNAAADAPSPSRSPSPSLVAGSATPPAASATAATAAGGRSSKRSARVTTQAPAAAGEGAEAAGAAPTAAAPARSSKREKSSTATAAAAAAAASAPAAATAAAGATPTAEDADGAAAPPAVPAAKGGRSTDRSRRGGAEKSGSSSARGAAAKEAREKEAAAAARKQLEQETAEYGDDADGAGGEDDDGADGGEGEGADGEGGEELFCVCRQPYDAKRFMIGCDKCDGWFHARCVNISVALAQKLNNFICPPCRKSGAQTNKEQQAAESQTANDLENGIDPEDEDAQGADADDGEELEQIQSLREDAQKSGGGSKRARDKKDNKRARDQRSPSPTASSRRTPIDQDDGGGGGGGGKKKSDRQRSASALAMDPAFDRDGDYMDGAGGGADGGRRKSNAEKQAAKRRREDKTGATAGQFRQSTGGAAPAVPQDRYAQQGAAAANARRAQPGGKPPLPAVPAAGKRIGGSGKPAGGQRRTAGGRLVSSPQWRSQNAAGGDSGGEELEDLDLDDGDYEGPSTGIVRTGALERAERGERGERGERHHHHHHHHHHLPAIDWAVGEEYSSEEELEGVYLTSDDEDATLDAHTQLDAILQQHIAQRDDVSLFPSKQPGYVRDMHDDDAEDDNDKMQPEATKSEPATAAAAAAAAQPSALLPALSAGPVPLTSAELKAQRKANDVLYKRSLIVDARALSRSFDDLGETLLFQALTMAVPPVEPAVGAVAAEIQKAVQAVQAARADIVALEAKMAAAAVAALATENGNQDAAAASGAEAGEAAAAPAGVPAAVDAAADPAAAASASAAPAAAASSAAPSTPSSADVSASFAAEFDVLLSRCLAAHQQYLDLLRDPELASSAPLHKGTPPALVDHHLVLHMERNKSKVECALLQLEQKRRLYLSGLAYSARASAIRAMDDETQALEELEAEELAEIPCGDDSEEGTAPPKRRGSMDLEGLVADAATATAPAPSAFPLTSSLLDSPNDLPRDPTAAAGTAATAAQNLAAVPAALTSSISVLNGSVGLDDLKGLAPYKHLLTGLFPPEGAEESSNSDETESALLQQSESMSARAAPCGAMPLGRLNELALEFLQCPSCFGLIPCTGYHTHTLACSLSTSTLSADPNIQRKPLWNQNYPPAVWPTAAASAASANASNVTHLLLPLPQALMLPLPMNGPTRHPHQIRSQLVPRDLTSAAGAIASGFSGTGSKAQAQQAYLVALQEIDGRLTRFAGAKWDLGATATGQDLQTTVCGCPLVDPANPAVPKFCPMRKAACSEHLLWEDLFKSNMEQQYFVLCRRLELLKCELECVYARIHDRAIAHGLQPFMSEEQQEQQRRAQMEMQAAQAQQQLQFQHQSAYNAQLAAAQQAAVQQAQQHHAQQQQQAPMLAGEMMSMDVDPSEMATMLDANGVPLSAVQLTPQQQHAMFEQQQALLHQQAAAAQQAAAVAAQQAQQVAMVGGDPHAQFLPAGAYHHPQTGQLVSHPGGPVLHDPQQQAAWQQMMAANQQQQQHAAQQAALSQQQQQEQWHAYQQQQAAQAAAQQQQHHAQAAAAYPYGYYAQPGQSPPGHAFPAYTAEQQFMMQQQQQHQMQQQQHAAAQQQQAAMQAQQQQQQAQAQAQQQQQQQQQSQLQPTQVQ